MCIRDSSTCGGNVNPLVLVEIPAGETKLGMLGPHARANGCLLYTSDAADERSSVDLGGRRIIKKKTTSILLITLIRVLPCPVSPTHLYTMTAIAINTHILLIITQFYGRR